MAICLFQSHAQIPDVAAPGGSLKLTSVPSTMSRTVLSRIQNLAEEAAASPVELVSRMVTYNTLSMPGLYSAPAALPAGARRPDSARDRDSATGDVWLHPDWNPPTSA